MKANYISTVPLYPDGCFAVIAGGYLFDDFRHSQWELVCDNPDAENPTFSEPKFLYHGFLRCKPTFLKNGDWLCLSYNQLSEKYCYYISRDEGKTYIPYEGPKKFPTFWDEGMAYQRLDGSIRMFDRTSVGEIAECFSEDNGITWTDSVLSGIDNPNTRFYVSRTPLGNVLLINNDDRKDRKNMTIYLSDDDGDTWKYKKCIDERLAVSYPDADFYDGTIYLVYDRERTGAKEILFVSFTEEDIINPDKSIKTKIISKP